MHLLELCRTDYVMRLCAKLALATMSIQCFMFLNVGRLSGNCSCMAPTRVTEPAEQLMNSPLLPK